jgi:hypothetical protein
MSSNNTPYYSHNHYTANTSLHFTTLHPTTLQCTYRHFTSSHLHFTTLSFGLTHLYFLPISSMVVFLFNTVIYVFLLLGLCILIVQLPWLRFFRAFSSVVRQMLGYNSPRRGTVRTVPITFLCRSMYCLFFLSFCVLFVCKCVLYYCHRLSTQLQLTNISISKIGETLL